MKIKKYKQLNESQKESFWLVSHEKNDIVHFTLFKNEKSANNHVLNQVNAELEYYQNKRSYGAVPKNSELEDSMEEYKEFLVEVEENKLLMNPEQAARFSSSNYKSIGYYSVAKVELNSDEEIDPRVNFFINTKKYNL